MSTGLGLNSTRPNTPCSWSFAPARRILKAYASAADLSETRRCDDSRLKRRGLQAWRLESLQASRLQGFQARRF